MFGTSSEYSDNIYEDGYLPLFGIYKCDNGWYAQWTVTDETVHLLGPFTTSIEAAIYYNTAAENRLGPAAVLNFPEHRSASSAHKLQPEI